MSKFIISFQKSNGSFRVWSSDTNKISTVPMLPAGNGKLNKFIMLDYDDNKATDEDLLEYSKQFTRWCTELKDSYLSIDYKGYYSDYTAVTCTFNRYCKSYYKNHSAITPTEYKWFERCANFGLQYLRKEDTTKTCYSYDFKNQYGIIMSSNEYKIPSKEGKEVKLKKLPKRKKLEYGFYHVKITCDNDDFRKFFAFSKHNVYLKESLQLAMKHADEYDVTIELVQDDLPNAYLYDESDMVTLGSITKEWYTKLTGLRKQYNDNRLLKHLIKSAWGHLNGGNKLYKSWEEIESEGLEIGTTDEYAYKILKYNDYGDRECYELLNTKSPYKHNIRLKPWITGLARNLTASIVLEDIKHVIRVHTDSVTFTKKQEFDDPNLIVEDKTTGKIHWLNVNKYHNITTGYKTKTLLNEESKE
jgi:hypothetical protein